LGKDHILFIIASVLMGLHVIHGTIQANESLLFNFSLFAFLYLVISSIWHKLKEKIRLSITRFGTLLVLYNQLFNKLREKKKASL
jgi:hypothetical protein